MGAHGDIIFSGVPGITSRAHRSPHKLVLNPVCRLAPAPRQTISSILLFSSLISSASLPAGSRFVPVWARMWLWRSGCHPASVTGSLQRVWLCPQTWRAALRNLEIPSLEIPSEKKNGSQGGFVHKMKNFCPFYA